MRSKKLPSNEAVALGDWVAWMDSSTDPPSLRQGAVTMPGSLVMLVACSDGKERFVHRNDRSLRRAKL